MSKPQWKWTTGLRQRAASVLLPTLACLALSGCQPLVVKPAHPSTWHRQYASHLDESKRAGLHRVAIIAGDAELLFNVGGPDYGARGDEVGEGMAAGVGAALSPDISGSGEGGLLYLLLLPVIIPVAAGAGGVAGAVEAETRDNNKEAADSLVEAAQGQLANVLLAREVEARLDALPGMEAQVYTAAEIQAMETFPPADARLTLSVTEVTAQAIGGNGHMGVFVNTTLTRASDGQVLHEERYGYHDTRSMRAWTADNGAAWQQHLATAKTRIADRVTSNLFTGLELRHVLRPASTEDFSDLGRGTLKRLQPTLAWELVLLGDDTHLADPPTVDEQAITWDLVIRQDGQPIYQRSDLPGTSHTLELPLEKCRRYDWSVRPSYQLPTGTRVGEWMTVRQAERGATIAVERDFHRLKTPC